MHRTSVGQLGRMLLLGMAVLTLGTCVASAEAEVLGDPIPLRRVVLPADRLAAQLKRVKGGALVRMPRRDFEALVQRVARAEALRQPPRLVEARYRARLDEGNALNGTAQWKVLHRGQGTALLRLQANGEPINLALRRPRFENRDAILAEFPELRPPPAAKREGEGSRDAGPSESLALLVDRPGEHTVTLEWSARLEARPEGVQADLRLPACAVASVEIDLPVGRDLSVLDGTLVSGPHPAEQADRRLWKIPAGGKGHLPLLIRKNGGGEPVLFAQTRTVQKLSPDGLESVTTFLIKAIHREVREVVCACDPLLRPIEVNTAHLEGYEIQGGRLRVRLERPVRQLNLEVRCLAPLSQTSASKPAPVRWTSPAVRILGAVSEGEALELWLHPELRIGAWQPGDFRLLGVSTVVDLERHLKLRRLTLAGGGLASGAEAMPRRPEASIQAGGVEWSARQLSWWRLGSGRMELVTEVGCEVRSGLLFQVPLRLPAGWDVDAVELSPADLLRSWGVRSDRDGPLLLVELRRPFRPAAGGTLVVRLRGPQVATAGRGLPFPDVLPEGARFREGGLGIDPDERLYAAQVRSAGVTSEPPGEGPWGAAVPDFYYPFRGQPVSGTLHLRAQAPRFRARVQSDVYISSARVALQTELALEGDGGTSNQVDIYLSGNGSGPWPWHVGGAAGRAGNRVRRVERLLGVEAAAGLAALAARSPLHAVALLAARPSGTTWRVTLERPLGVRQSITLQATRILESEVGAPQPRWEVPLPMVLGASRQEGEVTLHLAGADPLAVEAFGLTEAAAPRRPASAWRVFRHGDHLARLTLKARAVQGGRGSGAEIHQARLLTILTSAGRLRHHFRFQAARWSQRSLPVRLPIGAVLVAAGVDGYWLEHLTADEEGSVELPVPAGGAPPVFELLYETAAPSGPWRRLEAPAPGLPVEPVGFRRAWFLPPGLAPLADARLRRLPGRDALGMLPRARQPVDLFRLGGMLPLGDGEEGERSRHQVLAEVAAGLRSEKTGATLSLGTLVEEVAFSYLQGVHPLLVDRTALSRAGVGGHTTVMVRPAGAAGDRALPWEDLGLVALPYQAGILLTSPGMAPTPGEASEVALAEAVRNGSDPSGRFLSALDWLASREPGREIVFFPAGESLDGWSAWLPVTSSHEDTLTVVDRRLSGVLGLVLAGLGVMVLILLRLRPARVRLMLLLGGVGVAGLGLAWLPAVLTDLALWPLAAGLLLSLGWYLRWVGRPAPRRAAPTTPASPLPPGGSTLTTAGLLLLLVLPAGQAQKAEPEVVYIVPAAPGTEETVLVPPTLLAQLEARARAVQVPGTGVLLLSALYEGKLERGRVEFAATFQLHALGEEAELTLPLEGVQLVGDVLLDGARAFPVALPGGRPGYALTVRGQGKHRLEMRFRVPVGAAAEAGGLRQVRFGVPRLVQSRLTFDAPTGVSHLQVPVKHGAQRVTTQMTGVRLDADLGALTVPVQVRWYQEEQPARPARVVYHEAYLWDLAADASILTALLRYTIGEGATTSLEVALPSELEVRSAQARRPPVPGGAEAAVRLSDWSVQEGPGGRVLRLDFPSPVNGAVELLLEMVPRGPWVSSARAPVLLPLPRPTDQPAAQESSYLAYRTRGVEVTRSTFGVTGIQTRKFAPFWPAASRPDAATLAYACTFHRTPKQPPELRLHLRPSPGRLRATQLVRLAVGPRQADLTARIELTAPGKDLSLVEWYLGSVRPVVITQVTGADVHRWHQDGTRLLVWLEKTTDTARLELSGWVPLTEVSKAKTPITSVRLDLPNLRLAHAAEVRTELVVAPGPGLSLTPEGLRDLKELGKPDRERRYLAGQGSYAGSFLVRPGPAPRARITTRVAVQGREVTLWARIDYAMPGEMRGLSVRLRDWDGDARLEAPARRILRRREQSRRADGRRERTWTVELAPGVSDRFSVELRGRLPLDEAVGGVTLPDVSVVGATTQRVLEVGPGLVVEEGLGVVSAGEKDGAHVWKVTADGWSLRVAPQQGPRSGAVQVVLGELRASIPDGLRWLHEGTWLLRHDGPAELSLLWPAGVEVALVAIDGVPVTVMQPEKGRLWLPLSGPGGARRVQVRWRYLDDQEPVDRPILTLPEIEGVSSGPSVWTIDVPAGWEIPSGGLTGATRRAAVELYRAAAELALGREEDDPLRGSEEAQARARGRLRRSLWLAGLAIQGGANARRRLGPDGLDLETWLGRLRENAQRLVSEPVASREDRSNPPRGLGTPVSWVSQRERQAPRVRLVPAEERRLRQALAVSGQWLLVLLLVWTVSLSQLLRTLARWLWPELALLLGVLGWQLIGPTVVVLFLVVLGVCGRALLIGIAARRLMPE